MPEYQIGDVVDVNVTYLEHTPGSGAMLLDEPDPRSSGRVASSRMYALRREGMGRPSTRFG